MVERPPWVSEERIGTWILDGFDLGVALLDPQGTLRYSNAPFRHYSATQPFFAELTVGSNLLERYLQAAHPLAGGLEQLVQGKQAHLHGAHSDRLMLKAKTLSEGFVLLTYLEPALDEQLMQSTLLHNLAGNAQDVLYRYNLQPEPHYAYISPAIEQLSGYPAEAFYDDPYISKKNIHPDDQDKLLDFFEHTKTDLTSLRWRHKEGHVVWTEQRHNLLYDEVGQPLAIEGIMRDVTAQKQAEAALRENETLFATVFRASPVGMAITAWHDGRVIEVNKAYCDLFAYSREQMLGCSTLELGLWAEPEMRTVLLAHLETEGKLQGIETRWRRPDGQECTFLGSYERIELKGQPYLLSLLDDISERKRAEEENLRLRQRLDFLIDNVPAVIYTLSPQGAGTKAEDYRLSFVSPSTLRVYGYSAEKLLHDPTFWREQVHPEDREKILPLITDLLERGEAQHHYRFRDADGVWRWKWDTLRLLRNERGQALEAVGFSIDIQAQKEAEWALEEERARLYRTLELARAYAYEVPLLLEGNVVTSGAGRYSGPLERVIGYSPDLYDRLMSEQTLSLVHPQDVAEIMNLWSLLQASNQPVTKTFRLLHADGHYLWLRQHWRREGDSLLCFTLDVTETIETRAQAEAAERANAAKSGFFSFMSHEFRTPLTVIMGFAELLELSDLAASDRRALADIRSAAQHLLELVTDTLDLAQLEAGRMSLNLEPVPIAELLEDTLQLMQPLAQKAGVSLRLEPPPALRLQLDYRRAKQVLLNLLSNAIKYNRPGGSVEVGCQLQGDSAGNRVRLTVRDSGRGLSSDEQARLFVPFERLGAANSNIGGSGLGLALSKSLIESMGGTIGVASSPGTGSTFWLEFPHSAPSSPPPRPARPPRTRRVLYIEDHPGNIRLMQSIMTLLPHVSLSVATHGAEGLRRIRQDPPDLVLLDMRLPDMNGSDIVEALERDPLLQKLPIIVISADADAQTMYRVLKAGVSAYLTKPLEVQRLVRLMLELLEEGAD